MYERFGRVNQHVGPHLVGALIAVSVTALNGTSWASKALGFFALILACVNIFGGFLVTNRMLGMFRK